MLHTLDDVRGPICSMLHVPFAQRNDLYSFLSTTLNQIFYQESTHMLEEYWKYFMRILPASWIEHESLEVQFMKRRLSLWASRPSLSADLCINKSYIKVFHVLLYPTYLKDQWFGLLNCMTMHNSNHYQHFEKRYKNDA